MVTPAHPGILLHTAGEENCHHYNGSKAQQADPEWYKGPCDCIALQLETMIGKTPLKAYKI